MRRILGVGASGLVLAAGLWMSSSLALAHAAPYPFCDYRVGDKIATVPCGEEALAEPGMAGNLPMPLVPLPAAQPAPGQQVGVSPGLNPSQRQFIADLVGAGLTWTGTDQQMIAAGESTCASFRGGLPRDHNIGVVYQSLRGATLEQAAAAVDASVRNLCPEFSGG